jgi:hypothetical protein
MPDLRENVVPQGWPRLITASPLQIPMGVCRPTPLPAAVEPEVFVPYTRAGDIDGPACIMASGLEAVLHPASIAVAGASDNPESSGHQFLRGLLEFGYQGPIYPVNPNLTEAQGLPTYPSLADVPGHVDYAISCIPAASVLGRSRPGAGAIAPLPERGHTGYRPQLYGAV